MKKKNISKGLTFFPRKRLGQHFLIDRNAMDKVVRVADLSPDDHRFLPKEVGR
jgi:16S rRNA A1518/A1519 N6-dimethyltransferase RsmA/KsgA/DIM1 with predicted DNA glycosylase/AP lyase activity